MKYLQVNLGINLFFNSGEHTFKIPLILYLIFPSKSRDKKAKHFASLRFVDYAIFSSLLTLNLGIRNLNIVGINMF